MQVITVTKDGTLRIEFTADEAKQIREALERDWNSTFSPAKEFVRYVDTLYGEQRRPTFPGGAG
ncbi:hypothetical protein [Streptomyces canus]|uniref:hypothetical protein n=1 Tax=Streptomyces canus TaxID=58343 RepID=UPI00277E544D|nr:hypothetical protein [Streptomyces canus]MDQ0758710.1 bisphosphoglycerate-independent phosphoglycerate mutase (AlkP superfamily) [Streptomyces canus]